MVRLVDGPLSWRERSEMNGCFPYTGGRLRSLCNDRSPAVDRKMSFEAGTPSLESPYAIMLQKYIGASGRTPALLFLTLPFVHADAVRRASELRIRRLAIALPAEARRRSGPVLKLALYDGCTQFHDASG